MGYKAAVKILKQADDLKVRISKECDLLNSNEAWTDQQKLQTIYHQALVLDLEYALDKKVEQDLWNVGFKNHISILQDLTRDKKNSKRSDAQALLTWCLEAASGFYLTLLQDLCNTFDIDLPFRRRGAIFGQINSSSEQITLAQTSSCLYICQYCLVHLGDIARYRNQRKQAENFYKQAILVSPTSGQPYNQLALLETSQGDKLSTVYYYVMGISVKNPFPASTANLMKTLSSAIDKESPIEKIQRKMSVSEFIQLYLCTHGFLHTATDLKQAEVCVQSLNTTMTALVATQSFTKDSLIKLTIINLYSLRHTVGGNNDLGTRTDEMTDDELKVMELTLELITGSLSAFLVPVHTLVMDETLLDYYALPAVKLLMNFIQNDPQVLENKVFTNRLQIWPSLCKLLNNVQKYLKSLNYNKYEKVPLPEDKNLQGFVPFSKNFKNLNFKEDIDDAKIERLVRMRRILDLSLWLTEIVVNGSKLIIKNEINNELVFEPGCTQPDPTNDLLEEMKSFSIEVTESKKKTGLERKAGILKPQGSLEKSREEREMNSDFYEGGGSGGGGGASVSSGHSKCGESFKIKRGKQNVALQSIIKKMEENKQVKFSVDDMDKEKCGVKFDGKSKQKHQQTVQQQQQNHQPLRTQSFNQNHPAFPVVNANNQQSSTTSSSSSSSDFLTSLRNVPNMQMEKGTNFRYSNDSDLPKINKQMMMPPPPPPQAPNTYSQNHASYSNPQMAPFPNMPFPQPPHLFNNQINRDDLPLPPPPQANTWWQNNAAAQNNTFSATPRYDNSFQLNYPNYPNNMGTFLSQNPIAMKPDFSKPPPTGPNQGAGDIFNSSVWNAFPRNHFMNDGGIGPFENSNNHGISMRQAMLKEVSMPNVTNSPTVGRYPSTSNAPPTDKYMQAPQQNSTTPGYSLFNTNNSWNPTLPGQLNNTKMSNDNNLNTTFSQQSLFTGHGPMNLAQLLEQQSQIQKGDMQP